MYQNLDSKFVKINFEFLLQMSHCSQRYHQQNDLEKNSFDSFLPKKRFRSTLVFIYDYETGWSTSDASFFFIRPDVLDFSPSPSNQIPLRNNIFIALFISKNKLNHVLELRYTPKTSFHFRVWGLNEKKIAIAYKCSYCCCRLASICRLKANSKNMAGISAPLLLLR